MKDFNAAHEEAQKKKEPIQVDRIQESLPEAQAALGRIIEQHTSEAETKTDFPEDRIRFPEKKRLE